MAITASMVKELRESTGAGMMDAKKALTETDGDMEAAVDWLRTKGLAKAAKKSGRTAAEGLVAVATEGGKGVAVEVNSETDFVGKNSDFQTMVSKIATAAIAVDTVEDLKATSVDGKTIEQTVTDAIAVETVEELKASSVDGKTIEQTVTDAIAVIGENMSVRRMATVHGSNVVSYVHNSVAPGMGSIGVLVGFDGSDEGFARQVAMHIAAANPAALGEADLDPAMVEKEKSVQMDIARESGKPEAVIEKMIVGRMAKFMAESTLMGQAFVVNPDLTVEKAAAEAGVTITSFVRLEVGEGIEVAKEDFAAEVAKLNA